MRESDILWDVVEEHLDEAAFLWTQWERALVSPNYTLKDVIRGPEERLLAHIDGLLVAGEPAVERLLIPALEGDEADKVFAAAITLLEGPTKDAFARVMRRLTEADPNVAFAVARALALAHRKGIEEELLGATRAEVAPRIAAALSALATRRVSVPDLAPFLATGDTTILQPALRAARVGGPRYTRQIEDAFASKMPAVREAALEAGLVVGMRSAWKHCQQIAEDKTSDAAFPLLVLAISGDESDLTRITRALDSDVLLSDAIVALGYTGRVGAADACVRYLGDEKVAPLAGEALSAIVGFQIDGQYRRGFDSGEGTSLEEEQVKVDLVNRPEAMLPSPQPEVIQTWWQEAKASFDNRVRYIGGKPWSAETMALAISYASMRRRRVLALEFAIRMCDGNDVDTGAWARDQQRALQGDGPTASLFAQPFDAILRYQ